ncbi:hypothetical protein BDQ17DRAFT_1412994 [Cyathus striatus]|nr:hypothetical protein BDQ17DRAFT_1412994 [Cyathus striatus]
MKLTTMFICIALCSSLGYALPMSGGVVNSREVEGIYDRQVKGKIPKNAVQPAQKGSPDRNDPSIRKGTGSAPSSSGRRVPAAVIQSNIVINNAGRILNSNRKLEKCIEWAYYRYTHSNPPATTFNQIEHAPFTNGYITITEQCRTACRTRGMCTTRHSSAHDTVEGLRKAFETKCYAANEIRRQNQWPELACSSLQHQDPIQLIN